MTDEELAALAVSCPILAAKARNHLQVELATILREKDPTPWDEK